MSYTEEDVRLVADALNRSRARKLGVEPRERISNRQLGEARRILRVLAGAGRLLPADARTDERRGYETAIAVLHGVYERTGSPAARWAADYLAADPDREAPAGVPVEPDPVPGCVACQAQRFHDKHQTADELRAALAPLEQALRTASPPHIATEEAPEVPVEDAAPAAAVDLMAALKASVEQARARRELPEPDAAGVPVEPAPEQEPISER
jgi:hypothetical protein